MAAKTQTRALQFIDSVNKLSTSSNIPKEYQTELFEKSHKLQTVIIQSNVRLVYSIARQYQGMGVDINDLIDEGILGLRKALSKYDVNKGYAFSTYAYPWIKEYMRSALSKSLPITLPQHVYKLLVKVRLIQGNFFAQHGRPPTDEELTTAMGLTPERFDVVRRAFALAAHCNSGSQLNALQNEDTRIAHFDEATWEQVVESSFEDRNMIDNIKSTEQYSPSNPIGAFFQVDVLPAVLSVIQTLPINEAVIVYNRLGLSSHSGKFQYSKGSKKSMPLIGAMPQSAKAASELYSKGMRKLRRRMSLLIDEQNLHDVQEKMLHSMIIVNNF
jgi:RNA polymerase sigma factor (sigma-70 family)